VVGWKLTPHHSLQKDLSWKCRKCRIVRISLREHGSANKKNINPWYNVWSSKWISHDLYKFVWIILIIRLGCPLCPRYVGKCMISYRIFCATIQNSGFYEFSGVASYYSQPQRMQHVYPILQCRMPRWKLVKSQTHLQKKLRLFIVSLFQNDFVISLWSCAILLSPFW
jgi:hypothetical protein